MLRLVELTESIAIQFAVDTDNTDHGPHLRRLDLFADVANQTTEETSVFVEATRLACVGIRQTTEIAAALKPYKAGKLVPLLTNYQWPVSPAYAVYPPTRHLSYRVRAFIDFLVEQFSGTPQWDRDCAA